jgi:PKD repeat protein/DNA-binding PadR family transcriptional regulator
LSARSSSLGALALSAIGIVAVLFVLATPAHAAPSHSIAPVNCSTGLVLATSQSTGPAPLYVAFNLTSYWGTPTTARWSFGDGAYYNGSGAAYLHPDHRYGSIGQYLAIVSVSDGLRTGACSTGIAVTPPALLVHANTMPAAGTPPLTVQFVGTVSGGSGTFAQVGWSFGDGHSATGANLSYTYSVPGVYHAQFTVVDSDGASSSANATVNVVPPAATHPSYGGTLQSISILGAIAAVAAVFGGTLVLVRKRGVEFSPRRRVPDSSVAGDADTLALPGGPASPRLVDSGSNLPGSGGEAVPLTPRFRPELYRAVILDLSEREFGVLTPPPGPEPTTTAIVPVLTGSVLAPTTGPRSLATPPRPRLSQRVLLHLLSQPRLGSEDVATLSYTQAGMIDALEVPQSLLSNVLRRMMYSGVILREVQHVQGSDRRRNVYLLTPKGERVAEELRRAKRTPSAR